MVDICIVEEVHGSPPGIGLREGGTGEAGCGGLLVIFGSAISGNGQLTSKGSIGGKASYNSDCGGGGSRWTVLL